MIQRYSVYVSSPNSVQPDPDGEFVSHEDLLAAVRVERERCAKVCEDLAHQVDQWTKNIDDATVYGTYCAAMNAYKKAAAEIRNGGAE